MKIRSANDQDISAIVQLLKSSLGDGSTLKSESYWRWKHIENPFGQSPVLLAEVDGRVVGVRAFMRWQWVYGNRIYSALRAVDTATHPDYQGRGIFKKLTLQLLEECQKVGDDFIFNTPNSHSLPGYLKMGWNSVGKVPVHLKLRKPWRVLINKLSSASAKKEGAILNYDERFSVSEVLNKVKDVDWRKNPPQNKLRTPLSFAYLKWRYEDCPVQNYGAYSGKQFFMIFYCREQSLGTELRIVQLVCGADTKAASVREGIRQVAKQYQPDYLSLAPTSNSLTNKIIRRAGFLPKISIGPVLTLRTLQELSQPVDKLRNWEFDLGAFELF